MKFRGQEIDTGKFLDAGIHDVYIHDHKLGDYFNEEKKVQLFYVQFIFKEINGEKIAFSNRYYLHKEALWTMGRLAKMAGIGENEDFDAPDLIGKKVRIHVVIETYSNPAGGTGEKSVVKKIEPLGNDQPPNDVFIDTSKDPF